MRTIMTPDFVFGVTPGDLSYDIETFPNIFTCCVKHEITGRKWQFEISSRINDVQLFRLFLDVLNQQGCRMIGFNNLGFDYPVIHFIYKNRFCTVDQIYAKAMSIINADHNARFAHMIWDNDHIVPQIDLYKIYHFDNKAKATSLKIMEFNMRMNSVEDLPFDVGTHLTSNQMRILLDYNWHDVDATSMFYQRAKAALKLREDLTESFGVNMINMSDVKIGETLLIKEMENHGIDCYYYDGNQRKKKQTIRESVDLSEVIFPYVQFERSDFNGILDYFKSKVITETNGVFKGLSVSIDGIDYVFGTGGLHASVNNRIIRSTDTHTLVDVDVASFYPNMGIKNRLYPAHLGEQFCDAYESLYQTRKTYPKGTAENEAYKLALNGAYGGSNNEYSPFLDMFYTMSITINGQLSLCMLVEQLLKVPGLSMVQANTDGVTYLCPNEYIDHTRQVCRWWESITKLDLEEALYDAMMIRDVNSYIAVKQDGGVKRIGAYAHVTAEENPGTRELPYHKDWSARIVPMAAEAALVHGRDIAEFIHEHEDIFDFFLRTKVPRSSILEWGGIRVANVVRYYVSTDGDVLEKVMPPKGPEGEYKRANGVGEDRYNRVMEEIGPGVWDERIHTKNKSQYTETRAGFHTGYTVMLCSNLTRHEFKDINYDWYIKEAQKLVLPLMN